MSPKVTAEPEATFSSLSDKGFSQLLRGCDDQGVLTADHLCLMLPASSSGSPAFILVSTHGPSSKFLSRCCNQSSSTAWNQEP